MMTRGNQKIDQASSERCKPSLRMNIKPEKFSIYLGYKWSTLMTLFWDVFTLFTMLWHVLAFVFTQINFADQYSSKRNDYMEAQTPSERRGSGPGLLA